MKRKNVSRITALGLCGTMLLSGACRPYRSRF